MRKGILLGIFCIVAVLFTSIVFADAPELAAITDKQVNEGATLTFTVTSSAPDNGNTTFSIVTGPTGATITGVSNTQATFSYTAGQVTSTVTYPVTISAADSNSTDYESFILTVSDVPQQNATNATKLEIIDLDVSVGSEEDKNLEDGDRVSDEAKPGDKVTFSVEVKNTFDEDINDTEIQDITVKITIFGIDDDDDLDEEADEFDLKAEKKKSVDIDFEVPKEVDEGDYDVEISVEGEDEDGVTHELTWSLVLEVKKDSHKISIDDYTLSPATVQCSRDATLDIRLLNIGGDDEDEVVLEVKNTDLGINVRDTGLELDEGVDDNDYSKTISISAANIKAGNYPISIKSYYDTSKQSDSKTVTLTVQDCETQKPVVPEEEEEEEKNETISVVTIPPVSTTGTAPVTAQPIAPVTYSIRDSTAYTAVLIILIVIIIILLVFAIVSIARRR